MALSLEQSHAGGGGATESPPTGTEPTNSGPTDTSGEQQPTQQQEASGVSRKGAPWSEAEHLAFLHGLKKLGRGNWRGISKHYVPTRTPTQVASHAQKHFMRVAGATKRKSRFTALEQEVLGTASSAPSTRPQQKQQPSAVPTQTHSSGSSEQHEQQQHVAQYNAELLQQQQQAAAAAFPMGSMPFPYMMHPMMFAFSGAPFMPPFMCPPPALAAAAAMNAAAFQKQGGMPMMPPMAAMFPMFQAGFPAYAMMAQAAAAMNSMPQHEHAATSAEEQQQHLLLQQVKLEQQPMEQQQQPPAVQLPLVQLPSPQPSQAQQLSPPGSPGNVCKPEATLARRQSPEQQLTSANNILSILPTTQEVQVAFHASSHSAFRPPQEVRAES